LFFDRNAAISAQQAAISEKEVIRKYTQIGYFTLNLDDAKEYLYAKSTKRRILSWRDIHVNVFI
jgi:Leu/Phe-tRNA-protein transferase